MNDVKKEMLYIYLVEKQELDEKTSEVLTKTYIEKAENSNDTPLLIYLKEMGYIKDFLMNQARELFVIKNNDIVPKNKKAKEIIDALINQILDDFEDD